MSSLLAQPFYRAGDATTIVDLARATGHSRFFVIGVGVDISSAFSRSY
ncbi:hypothetical protein [Propionibacterium sp. oral taxon 192]|nr:hypothetical protein [Propionibacterium sp. oral taxon 192]